MFEHGRRYTVRPAPELAVRRGMGRMWDLGGKLGVGNLEASARFQRVDHERFALALVPGLRTSFAIATNNTTDLNRWTAFGHVVVERTLAERVALVATATPALTLAGGTTADLRVLFEPAVGLGVRIGVGRIVVWPEATIAFPYAFSAGWEPPRVQAGIGFEL